MKKGLLLAVVQSALILTILLKQGYDKRVLPKGWAKVEQVVSVSGYYATLHLSIAAEPNMPVHSNATAYVSDGMLKLKQSSSYRGLGVLYEKEAAPARKIAMNIFWPKPPEGGEIWLEAAIPPRGKLRPLRLGKKNGGIVPYFDY